MKFELTEIAKLVNGKIIGNSDIVISSLAKIDEAKPGELTFLYLSAYEKFFPVTKASAILVKPEFNKSRNDITYIEVDEPDKAFSQIVVHYFTPTFPLNGIDKTASIDDTAILDSDVSLGKNVVISAGCKIGRNVKIYHNTVLLDNVEIGDDSLVFQNVSIREDCKLDKRVIVHAGTVIGSDGFGYKQDDKGVYHKIPQIGNVVIEDDVEIGANVTIDRAAIGSTIIKKGVKIDNLVQIAHNVVVADNTVMSAQVGISGSTKIGKNCILAGQVGTIGHIDIADKTVIIAQSGVSKSIKKPGYYFGSPAKELKTAKIIEAHTRNLPEYARRIDELEHEIKVLKAKLKDDV
ncbi:MAG: UDP-3-O-(3-hydroxymyristoyl)glucosamine N-acyltransferase [Ignavibacteria bacterium]|nr:UDP-3-O-(3-hydroxymyristoyl)glucosamine N-acyltransferase [Ignavibacteria bacterium]MBT8380784.1 UDP-3-O-(3-hydroxymyristoyl)glucosamine N-acyltransferase [Ignavibacteria bacterium]MBT8392878.1 UDP-3-O-(3-hydroxymyristoyl)glucosamine N-acyltransferase [Ignavibacteria bacterium]NNL19707.1 UDP-3-O-(3-hydroxymyristoyl)glucosamine N-acyltransferase [Ignavibacteriaceae bacterium]